MNSLGIEEDYFFELLELVNEAEESLLNLEKGFDDTLVSSINRCFHSLKGNTGMLGLLALETLFHKSESTFISQTQNQQVDIDKFLSIIDITKSYFDNPTEEIAKRGLLLLDGTPSRAAPPPSPAQEQESKIAKVVMLNVFHLDDEPDILEVIAMQLADYNCQVHSFTTPDQMKETIIQGHIPDLFIIDYNMPAQNGNTVINGLNAILPKIPKILLSGFVDKKVMFESINRGVLGVLEKPIDTFYLEKILKKSRKIKVQNQINIKTYELAMEYEGLSQNQIKIVLEDLKKLILSTHK